MVLPSISQTTLKGSIESVLNENGDTLIVMSFSDAKLILTDLLEYEITDSLLNVYVERDSLNQKKIIIKEELIKKLELQNENKDKVIQNLEELIKNNKEIISLKDKTIEEQNKEIKKQRNLKRLGFVGSIVLPILTLIQFL
jgi:vacuolar-type H+-ATPase subunit I/STV1